MRSKIMVSAAAVLSLVATPVFAQAANPAASLSVAKASSVRASTATTKSSKLEPGAWAAVVGALAIVAGAVIIAADGDDNPDSN
jgi:uncharacterized membrane protein HdeD (DUF308 family)